MLAEFDLSTEQNAALEEHLELLMQWNSKINLTAIRDREEAVERHYRESLVLAASLPAGPLRIADVGSGAGFPGFPVAVFRPDCTVTLIESHQRKAVFLREASRKARNIRVIAKRAQEVRDSFDWVMSRAVSYDDLRQVLKKLAPNAVLLSGSDAPPDSLGFWWEEPVPLAGGENRFLRVGHLVSRETA